MSRCEPLQINHRKIFLIIICVTIAAGIVLFSSQTGLRSGPIRLFGPLVNDNTGTATADNAAVIGGHWDSGRRELKETEPQVKTTTAGVESESTTTGTTSSETTSLESTSPESSTSAQRASSTKASSNKVSSERTSYKKVSSERASSKKASFERNGSKKASSERANSKRHSFDTKHEVKENQVLSTGVKNLVGERFSKRRKRLNTLCATEPYQNIKRGPRSSTTQFAARLDWCHIPKVATTFLKRVNHENSKFVKSQVAKTLQTGPRKRFFLVREPYSRVLSAYICKIVTTPDFWYRYGKAIISRFRAEPSKISRSCGHDVSFPEFVKFLILSEETGKYKNIHFMPIHEQCKICENDFDFVVHLETLKDDMAYVLQSVNVSINMDIREPASEMINKIKAMISATPDSCSFRCSALKTLWWSFQVRGFVSTDDKFPLFGSECETIPIQKFSKLVRDAFNLFTDRAKRSKQKRDLMTAIYLQVPLTDRLKLREVLMKDFELFGYDPQPKDLFPELSESG